MVTRALGTPAARSAVEQLAGARAATARARATCADHPASSSSTISLRRRSSTGPWSRMNCRRHHQVVADELVGVLVAPRAAVLLDDRVLGGDPVGLGVDEGAVHVPEDRGGQAEVGEVRARP